MSLTEPIKLSGPVGSRTFNSTTSSIQASEVYNEATPLPASNAGTLWVVYTVANWDHDHPASDNKSTVIEPNSATVQVNSPIRSLQGFNVENPGIVMFEHSQFRGFGDSANNSVPVLAEFPSGKINGVSSVIITGGKWSFHTEYNYTGTTIAVDGKEILTPGRYDFADKVINDLAKSVKYVGPSS